MAADAEATRGGEGRLERILEAEGVARMRLTAVAVTAALAAIAPAVALATGMPEALYYHALSLLFAASVWGQYLLARRGAPQWTSYAVVAANFALMTVMLVVPNPFSALADYEFGPSVMLRSGNVVYMFVLLAALAFSFSPRVVIWGGVCAATFWSLARLWVATRPGMVVSDGRLPEGMEAAEALERMARPDFMDVGIWVQEVVAILVVAGILALVVRGSGRMLRRQAALERRQANLARYVPAQMAERMAEADVPFAADRETVAAVLFTDIVGFTGWAETRSSGEVMTLLRDVHGMVAEEVFRAGGVLDKFIGDGTMATFGAAADLAGPDGAREAARRALDCAEALLAASAKYNRERAGRGEDPMRLSVGLHVGPVLVGDVGAAGRMELSVVGDAVNVASRLEAATRLLKAGAATSGAVIAAAGGAPKGWRPRGPLHLPGRHESVAVWTLDHAEDDPARPEADHPPADRVEAGG